MQQYTLGLPYILLQCEEAKLNFISPNAVYAFRVNITGSFKSNNLAIPVFTSNMVLFRKG